jgi:hypothetical protein
LARLNSSKSQSAGLKKKTLKQARLLPTTTEKIVGYQLI